MQNKQQLYASALSVLGLNAVAVGVASPTVAIAAPAKTNAITHVGVTTTGDATRITIVGTQPFTPNVRNYGSQSSTVITIGGQWSAGRSGGYTNVSGGYTNVRKNGVINVRAGRFTSWPNNQVRIVANTRTALTFSTEPSADRTRWEIVVRKPGTKSAASVKTIAVPAKQTALEASFAAKPVLALDNNALVSGPLPSRGVPFSARPAAVTPAAPKVSAGLAKVASSEDTLPNTVHSALPRTPMVKSTASAKGSKAAYSVAAAPPALVIPVAGVRAPQDAVRRVTLDFVAADINDVLKALSLQSGVNIVTGADVKGTVTVALRRVPLTEALDMVARLSGFQYARFGSAYVIGTAASVASITAASPEKPAESVTEFIPYRFNSQAAMQRALGDRFAGLKLPTADAADTPSKPKMLILTDTPKRIAEVREFVEKMEQAAAAPTVGIATEVYQVRYASPVDLANILSRLVPTVSVQTGPSQAFQPNALGGSASFSASPSPAGGGTGGGGAPGGAAPSASPGGSSSPTSTLPNTLLLTGAAADVARARQVLTQVDVKTPQMVFEARVVDLQNTDDKSLGLRYDFTRGVNVGETNFDGGVATTSPTIGPGYLGARPLGFGSILRTPYSVNVALDALQRSGKSNTLASPNLSALEGQPATAFIGDQIKYVSSITQSPTGQSVTTETATVGVTLKVTGRSSPDGTITLYVHPEVSVISTYLNLGNGIALPQIATRFVDTTIRVKDGETIGIGGLIREQDITNVQKVPGLGDLPFFGQLFRSTTKSKARSEVIIFITSRILKD